MIEYLKRNHLSLIIVAILAVAVFGGSTSMFGASPAGNLTRVTNPQLYVSGKGTLQVGDNGSTIAELKATTCAIANADTSVAATSTAYVYCTGITGLASGDVVLAQLSTTTPNTRFGGWVIQSARASTTAGAIDMMLYNGTGVAAVPSATSVGSTTNVWYLDN